MAMAEDTLNFAAKLQTKQELEIVSTLLCNLTSHNWEHLFDS